MRRALFAFALAVVLILVQAVSVTSHLSGDADAAAFTCSHVTGAGWGPIHEIPSSWPNYRVAHKVIRFAAEPPYVESKKMAAVYTKGPGFDLTWDYSHTSTVYCGF